MSDLTYLEKIVLEYVLKNGTIDGISKELYNGVVITDDEAKIMYSNTCKKLHLGEGRYSMQNERKKELALNHLVSMLDEAETDEAIVLARIIVRTVDTITNDGVCSVGTILSFINYPATAIDWKYGFTSLQDFKDFLNSSPKRSKYIKEVRT